MDNLQNNADLQNELYFRINKPLAEYIDVIAEHKIQPTSYFETKYNLYKSNVSGFNSLFKKPFLKETILLYYKDLLCAVFYKFNGNQLDYFHNILLQYLPKKQAHNVSTTDRNSILYLFTKELLIEVKYTENGTTGICVMNSQFRSDQLKPVQEKEYELMLIKNGITF